MVAQRVSHDPIDPCGKRYLGGVADERADGVPRGKRLLDDIVAQPAGSAEDDELHGLGIV
jgi:hypothetical protein